MCIPQKPTSIEQPSNTVRNMHAPIAKPCTVTPTQTEAGMRAELVLATLLESQMDKLQQQANHAPTTVRPRCAQTRSIDVLCYTQPHRPGGRQATAQLPPATKADTHSKTPHCNVVCRPNLQRPVPHQPPKTPTHTKYHQKTCQRTRWQRRSSPPPQSVTPVDCRVADTWRACSGWTTSTRLGCDTRLLVVFTARQQCAGICTH